MKLKFPVKKIAVLTLAGVISIAGAGVAFAEDEDSSQEDVKRFPSQKVNFEEMSAIYQSALDILVDEGTLTQEEADAITESMPARGDRTKPEGEVTATGEADKTGEVGQPGKAGKAGAMREYKNPLSELVTAGTITQEQLDSILEALEAAKDSDQTMSDVLDELVSEEVLTQEEADAITESMPARGDRVKPEGEATATVEGTGEADKAGEGRGPGAMREHMNPLSELVTAGTITQEQADAVNEAVKAAIEAAREAE